MSQSGLLFKLAHTHLTTLNIALAPSEFRIFDDKLTCGQKVKVYFFTLLLTLIGGFLAKIGYAAPARTSAPLELMHGSVHSRCQPHRVAGSVGSGRLR